MKKEITAIIIDDEPKACKLLELLVAEVDPTIRIIKKYNSPQQAISELSTLKDIQLIFLDIDMPGMNGFEFLKNIDRKDRAIVFVTGYNQYAIDAMKVVAAGYVLKPIDTDELTIAIDNAKKSIDQKTGSKVIEVLMDNISQNNLAFQKIGIPSIMGLDFVKVTDIICCEGTDKYTKVKLHNQEELLSSYNIGEFKKILPDSIFFQAHRSYLVNITKISQYQKDGTIIMEDSTAIPLARRRKEEFLQLVTLPKK